MEDLIKNQLEELLYKYAYYQYNNHYSSCGYSESIRDYRNMIAPLITIAKKLEMSLKDIKASYCDWEYCADEFDDYDELTRYW